VTTIEPSPPEVVSWKLVFWLAIAMVASGLSQASGPPLGLPLGTAFLPAAFAVLAVVARKGDLDPVARPVGLLLLWAALTSLAFLSLALVVLHVAEPGSLREPSREIEFATGGEGRLSFMMGLLALSAATSMLGLFRVVRAAVHDIIPVEPTLFSHALGFSAAIAVTAIPLLPLFVLGKPPMPLPVDALPPDAPTTDLPSVHERALELAWFAAATFLVTGPGAGRTRTAVAARLGLALPPTWHLVAAGAVGLGLAWLRAPAVAQLAAWLSIGTTTITPDAWMPDQLSGPTLVALSLLAATGTEITFRGFLQPRFGIVLTNLLLVAPLAWTNNWDILFVVFAIGLVFGAMRSLSTTVTPWLAHVVFLVTTGWR
jgi:hypothetical protein